MMFKVVIAVACLVAVTFALPPVNGVYGGGNPGGYGGQGNPGGYGGQGNPGGYGGQGNPGGYGGQGNPGGYGGQGGAGGQGGGFGGKPVRPPCDTPGVASCSDCLTRSMCTFVGQIITECSGTTPYCNEGLCSATPSVECNEPVPIAA